MSKRRRLVVRRKRYYVDDILVMLPLAELEEVRNHLTNMGLTASMSPAALKHVLQKHTLVLRHLNEKIRAAKDYYYISQDSKLASPATNPTGI